MSNDKRIFSPPTLPVGINDFRRIIENKLDFVDKSLLVKMIIESGDEVILIARPRRFGKTLNMSMLQHFFAAEVDGKSTKGLFDNLKITQTETYLQHQGKYPVIFLTFKDVRGLSFESTQKELVNVMSKLYRRHYEVLDSDSLIEEEKNVFRSILSQTASKEVVWRALRELTEYLYRYYGKEPIVLIDEYDTPIHSGYAQKYYKEIVECMRSVLSPALKDNPYIHKAVLTGIMRVSKESLFTGLNNIKVYSILAPQYSEYFGFTEEEVQQLLVRQGREDLSEDIKNWYNGYLMGDTVIYNPWSIVNCLVDKGVLKPYWVNTSDNALIRDLLAKTSEDFKSQFELLLQEKTVEKSIDENIVFSDLQANEEVIWSLLLMSGYLKIVDHQMTDWGIVYKLGIPNQEVRDLYRNIIIKYWLSSDYLQYDQFLKSLIQGNIAEFIKHLNKIMLQTASTYDMAKEPEAFYHGLMLGLLASLNPRHYEIKSNRETGFGRYDIMVIPKESTRLGILLEVKNIEKPTGKQDIDLLLQIEAKKGLNQIKERQYSAELEQRNIGQILQIGLAFCGKRFKMEHEMKG